MQFQSMDQLCVAAAQIIFHKKKTLSKQTT